MDRTKSARSPQNVAAELGTRQRLVVAASELLRRQGYAATGVKAILTAAGAPYGSLYHFFPGGKEQLAVEALRSSGEAYRDLVSALFPPEVALLDAVHDAFIGAADLLTTTGFVEACPVAAIALETASHSEAIRSTASAAFDSWIDVLAARGRASGLTERDAHELAETLFMLLQGAFLLARTRRDARALTIAADAATDAVRHKLDNTTHNAVTASGDAPA